MRTPTLFTLLLCLSCIPKETTYQNNPSPIQAYSLDRLAIGLPLAEDGKSLSSITTSEKCDTILIQTFGTSDQVIGVSKYDNISLWKDPIKKITVDSLDFGDTATILSLHSCGREMYYKLKAKGKSFNYTPFKNIIRSYSGNNDLAEIHFNAAQNIYEDTLVLKRFIRLFETTYTNDTIRLNDEEMGPHLLSGHSAALILQMKNEVNISKRFFLGLKILKERSLNELKMNILFSMLLSLETHLRSPSLEATKIRDYALFLKTVVTDYENVTYEGFEFNTWLDFRAADIILRHWKSFQRTMPETDLLNTLLHSGNEMVHLMGVQLQSTLYINESKPEAAKDLLLTTWKKHPSVIRTFYKDDVQFSLIPVAITIDSLLKQTHNYQKGFSFIQQLQETLTIKDSIFNNFLENKKFQLCVESNCPGMDYNATSDYYSLGLGTYDNFRHIVYGVIKQHALRDIAGNLVAVKKGSVITDGVYGKDIKVLQEDVEGKILYEFGQYSDPDCPVKIESNESVFWVKKKDLQSISRPLFFSSSEKKDLITDPVVKEALPLWPAKEYLIRDINDDQIPDLIGVMTSEYAIDGRSMKTLWGPSERSNLNNYVTIIKDEMYLFDNSNLSKRSIRNEPVWKLNQRIPQHFNAIQYPVIRYKEKIFAFTFQGYLLEINDSTGTWINTYKFPGTISDSPVLDGEYLYVINQTAYSEKQDTLFSINLNSRVVMPLFAFKNEHGTKIRAANGLVYFSTGNHIYAVNKNNGTLLMKYNVDDHTSNFTLDQNRMIVSTRSSKVKAYDLNQPDPLWSTKIPDQLNPNTIVKSDILYACSPNQLFLISLSNGNIIKQLRLPMDVYHEGAMKYYDKKILISGIRNLMVIENR
jgi:outer membrane protein assembly factor BamB